eukprot:TRINITY_DN11945_c0_g1_i4.p1 TRINITY_DN11945_c0_g1~~TRINITY_DN11945_c0_g1_i4.p1  ORF type:complete len:361 (+),score=41.63 TRINITY_DN11945_c0_g1_i4:202-1284(+)
MVWRAALTAYVFLQDIQHAVHAVESSIPARGHKLHSRRLSDQKQLAQASCILNVGHGQLYLAQAGVAIDQATRKCNNPTTGGGSNAALCTVSVSEIIASFSYATAFLSMVANDCLVPHCGEQPCTNPEAVCAASITALAAATAEMVQSGAGLSYDCPGAVNSQYRRLQENRTRSDAAGAETAASKTGRVKLARSASESNAQWSPVQRPVWEGPGGDTKTSENDVSVQSAFCAIYIAQSAWYLARASLDIKEATLSCPGVTDASSDTAQALCGVDVTGVILSAMHMASFISGAVAQCSRGDNAGAACAGDGLKLAAAITQVANAAQGIFTACGHACRDRVTEPGDPLRRLRAFNWSSDIVV